MTAEKQRRGKNNKGFYAGKEQMKT